MLMRPRIRCTRCGGWLTDERPAVEERASARQPLTCAWCGEGYWWEVETETLAPVAWEPVAAFQARLAAVRHDVHCEAVIDGNARRATEVGA
jgi:hypothetical protein